MTDNEQLLETRIVIVKDGEKEMIIENISPAILDSEKLRNKKEAEVSLFEVFSKYTNKLD